MRFIDVVNLVLLKLREEKVETSDDTEYAQLVRQFVNEAKHDIEDAWQFQTQRHSITIFTEQGNTRYAVDRVGFDLNVYEVWNLTEGFEMCYGDGYWMNREFAREFATGIQRNCPTHIIQDGLDNARNPVFEVWPVPDGQYRIQINAVVKQEEYTQVAQDQYLVEIPTNPLILGAYYRAVEERGDDSSSQLRHNQEVYEKALRRAITRDIANTKGESNWRLG